ncbi:hypothetical protein [Propionivibrio sp.]|uniref:hypothetical protein n=1 Tax=Propionivibrio sp. TaxID=2212460 RepID=UPI002637F335|nr:hypothetical protein [Propionivibrio sp.]
MRLTEQQRSVIRATVSEVFGASAEVWLFGSRVDDTKRGGNIDLLIESGQIDVNDIVRAEITFLTKIQMKLAIHVIPGLTRNPDSSI